MLKLLLGKELATDDLLILGFILWAEARIMNRKYFKTVFILTLFTLVFNTNLSASCAQVGGQFPDYSSLFVGEDKWENFNRKVFIFNLKANKYVLRPVNIVWASIVPQYGIDRINSVYKNLNYPVRLAGNLLQNDFDSAKRETKRFFINTTVGIGGLYDAAMLKYNLQPTTEDIEQALAYRKVKQGNYLVLPIVTQGSTRDVAGWVLDLPLNPCNYLFFIGPISSISGGVSFINGSTYLQPIYKMADNYADPYLVSKQLVLVEKYIKNYNLDRKNFINDNQKFDLNELNVSEVKKFDKLAPDVQLQDYNPQNRETDSIRTMLFDSQKLGKSPWSELSIWNKNFNKKIKTASIRVDSQKAKLKYRYILQKDKTSPIAILYPSIGEGIFSNQSVVIAKLLYDKGYSVMIMGSSFNWEFAKSMPDSFKPGLPYQDAKYLRIVTSMAINQLQSRYKTKFDRKILVGTSFGGLTGLFVAQQEESDKMLGISKYIFICPPIRIFYALQRIDDFSKNWVKTAENIQENAAVTAEKIVQITFNDFSKDEKISLPLSEDEAQLAISYTMRQKLYDLVFTIEHASRSRKNDVYEKVSDMSFFDYAQEYLLPSTSKSIQQVTYDSSLYSMEKFLKTNSDFKIYHSLDDCFTTESDLSWLKKQTGEKTVLFSNGSHLGFLYRKEFLDNFLQDIEDFRLQK